MCRITFTKKEDETGDDETQHNYNHRRVNDHGEQDEEEDEQLCGSCGNLDVNSEVHIVEIARFAITYLACVCSKDVKPIPLHYIS